MVVAQPANFAPKESTSLLMKSSSIITVAARWLNYIEAAKFSVCARNTSVIIILIHYYPAITV